MIACQNSFVNEFWKIKVINAMVDRIGDVQEK
jgi:hypothetical protein